MAYNILNFKANSAPAMVQDVNGNWLPKTNDSGSIVGVIRDKADKQLQDKIDQLDDLDPDNPYTDASSDGSQTDSSSLTDTASTIDNLHEFLNNLGGELSSWKNFYDLMQTIYTATGADDFVKGDARLAITEKIADMVYNFTATLYSNAFQSQMWYEQQEYNSPLQQLHRLADAGLFSSFSQISSGNAQSAANTSPVSEVDQSGAAAIQAQQKQARMDRIMSGLGLSLELASLGVQGFQAATELGVKQSQALLNTAQASNIAQMTPHEVRNAAINAYVQQGQLRLFESQKRLNEANIPLLSAQEYSTYQMVNFSREQLSQAWQNMANTLYMFQKGQDLTAQIARQSNATQLASANIAAQASKYGSDKAAQASMYGSDQALAASKFSALSSFTMDSEIEGFQEVDHNGQVHGDLKFDTDLGFTGLETKVGGVYESGGKRYTKVRQKRSVPASEFIKRQSAWCSQVQSDNFDFKSFSDRLTDYLDFQRKFSAKIGDGYREYVRDSINPRY